MMIFNYNFKFITINPLLTKIYSYFYFLMAFPEVKHFDITSTWTTVPLSGANGYFNNLILNNIPIGTADEQRVGSKVAFKRFRCYVAFRTTGVKAYFVRFLAFCNTKNSGNKTFAYLANLPLLQYNNPMGFINYDLEDRMLIFHDEGFTLTPKVHYNQILEKISLKDATFSFEDPMVAETKINDHFLHFKNFGGVGACKWVIAAQTTVAEPMVTTGFAETTGNLHGELTLNARNITVPTGKFNEDLLTTTKEVVNVDQDTYVFSFDVVFEPNIIVNYTTTTTTPPVQVISDNAFGFYCICEPLDNDPNNERPQMYWNMVLDYED